MTSDYLLFCIQQDKALKFHAKVFLTSSAHVTKEIYCCLGMNNYRIYKKAKIVLCLLDFVVDSLFSSNDIIRAVIDLGRTIASRDTICFIWTQ